MRCSHCQTLLPSGAKFCTDCGQPAGAAQAAAAPAHQKNALTATCPACQATLPEDA
ncbi:MAG: zinc ribbon domain-containing protein, partial [Zoogloeaceae bacterium]|nr:zinc ribbon domain-containing protein [Zoogloeaceae bacterium]